MMSKGMEVMNEPDVNLSIYQKVTLAAIVSKYIEQCHAEVDTHREPGLRTGLGFWTRELEISEALYSMLSDADFVILRKLPV